MQGKGGHPPPIFRSVEPYRLAAAHESALRKKDRGASPLTSQIKMGNIYSLLDLYTSYKVLLLSAAVLTLKPGIQFAEHPRSPAK